MRSLEIDSCRERARSDNEEVAHKSAPNAQELRDEKAGVDSIDMSRVVALAALCREAKAAAAEFLRRWLAEQAARHAVSPVALERRALFGIDRPVFTTRASRVDP
ncbi:MAG: hypothetical protein QM770_09840 [Tepidisphaeraceae bacterium]